MQAHKSGDEVRLFTRGLNDITAIAAQRGRPPFARMPADDIVLDGESLAFFDDGRPRRFQDTMSGLGATDVFFFDALYLDGRSLIDEPLRDAQAAARRRRAAPRCCCPAIDTDDGDVAERFAADAVAAGHEGVIVKALDSTYQAGRRGATWRKVKPVHTLDLVVLAAEWGHGRRTGWLSNLHLGARGADGSFVMVGKTFKGMTDELLRWQTDELQARAHRRPEGITVHVRPELVVEIALDGVQVLAALSGRRRAALRPRASLSPRQDGRARPTPSSECRRCCDARDDVEPVVAVRAVGRAAVGDRHRAGRAGSPTSCSCKRCGATAAIRRPRRLAEPLGFHHALTDDPFAERRRRRAGLPQRDRQPLAAARRGQPRRCPRADGAPGHRRALSAAVVDAGRSAVAADQHRTSTIASTSRSFGSCSARRCSASSSAFAAIPRPARRS